MATGSLILGICALVYGPYSFSVLSFILGIPGIVMGIVSLKKTPEKKGMAKAGLVMSAAALVIGLMIIGAAAGIISAPEYFSSFMINDITSLLLKEETGELPLPYNLLIIFWYALQLFAVLNLIVILYVSTWKIFVKAGHAGWKCLIPFYDMYTGFSIVYGNGWKFLLLFIPAANIVFGILYFVRLARAFGEREGFAVGLVLLSQFFYPMLAFGTSEYKGPVTAKTEESEQNLSF